MVGSGSMGCTEMTAVAAREGSGCAAAGTAGSGWMSAEGGEGEGAAASASGTAVTAAVCCGGSELVGRTAGVIVAGAGSASVSSTV